MNLILVPPQPLRKSDVMECAVGGALNPPLYRKFMKFVLKRILAILSVRTL